MRYWLILACFCVGFFCGPMLFGHDCPCTINPQSSCACTPTCPCTPFVNPLPANSKALALADAKVMPKDAKPEAKPEPKPAPKPEAKPKKERKQPVRDFLKRLRGHDPKAPPVS